MNEVMQKTLAGKFDPLPSKISPEMCEIVASLLCGDPNKRLSSNKLLNMPICKLFMSGLLEIVQSQPAFQGRIRDSITCQMHLTKERLKNEIRRQVNQMEVSQPGAAASTTILEGAQPLNSIAGGITLYEGIIKKQSGLVNWKRRYLCIRAELEDGQTLEKNPVPKFKSLALVLGLSKDTVEQQCVATPFSELEDVFPVPMKYTGTNAQHVFAVAFKTGKRLLFQARGDAECGEWMSRIQDALGIGDG